jgi:hypothetical protein
MVFGGELVPCVEPLSQDVVTKFQPMLSSSWFQKEPLILVLIFFVLC